LKIKILKKQYIFEKKTEFSKKNKKLWNLIFKIKKQQNLERKKKFRVFSKKIN